MGNTTRPAVLEIKEGFWKLNQEVKAGDLLFKPFISDHFNEALNPSIFSKNLGLRSFIPGTVRKRSCEQWIERYPRLSRIGLEARSRALRLWFGEDYGFTDSEHFVTIANTCFEDKAP
jgi:hypothetical protein